MTPEELESIWRETEHEYTWTLTIESDNRKLLEQVFNYAKSLGLEPNIGTSLLSP